MNPLGRFFVCKLSATATVFSISPLWANEESGNDKQMNNNNVPINNVSMCQYANWLRYANMPHGNWHIGILAH